MRTFSALLGGCHPVELFEALAENSDDTLTVPDLEAMTSVPRMSLHRMMQSFETNGLVRVMGKRGKAKLYQLNMDRPTVLAFVHVLEQATLELLEADMAKNGRAPRQPELRVELPDGQLGTPITITNKVYVAPGIVNSSLVGAGGAA